MTLFIFAFENFTTADYLKNIFYHCLQFAVISFISLVKIIINDMLSTYCGLNQTFFFIVFISSYFNFKINIFGHPNTYYSILDSIIHFGVKIKSSNITYL